MVEASLKGEELSLERIGELEEKVFDAGTTEKTKEIGQSLLNRLDVKRNQLIAQKKEDLGKMYDPLERINTLRPLINYLAPEEIEGEFEAIEMEISLLDGQEGKIKEAATRQLEHLRLAIERPIVHELESNAPYSFIEKMQQVSKAIEQSNSLEPLQMLSASQKRAIFYNSDARRGA